MSTGRIRRFAKHLGLLSGLAPVVCACSSLSGLSDFSIKDQQWFSRPGKLFNQSSIETPPLNVSKAVTPDDLISADGMCPGMAASGGPADANASTDAVQVPATSSLVSTGSVALGHTECDVARAIGIAPDNVQLSNDPRGDRMALVTYTKGPRPGAYTFKAGRLTAVDRVDVPEPEKPARHAKPKKRSTG